MSENDHELLYLFFLCLCKITSVVYSYGEIYGYYTNKVP